MGARAGTQRQQIAAALQLRQQQLTTARQTRTLRRTSSSTRGRKEGDTDVATVIIPKDEAEAATAALRAVVASASPDSEPEPAEQPDPDAPRPDWAILHNEHDVVVLQAECQKLVNAMAQMGAQVNLPQIDLAARCFATMRLLVLKNICTEAEAQGEHFMAMRSILREALQSVEIQQAQRTGKAIQTVHSPKIVVAKR